MVQSISTYSVTKIVTMIKSLTAREVFRRCPEVKKQLWGGEFWTGGYFSGTVGKHGNEDTIGKHVKSQGMDYRKLHEDHQFSLF
jgi:putative transposase